MQPVSAIFNSGFARFSFCNAPSLPTTFCSAAARTTQELRTMMSAAASCGACR
jgi:hypothetical protein